MRISGRITLRRVCILSIGVVFVICSQYLLISPRSSSYQLTLASSQVENNWIFTASEQHIPTVSSRRRNLIIVGYDRSGTTYTTQVFNNDPNIFTVYEPLWFPFDWMRSYDRPANYTHTILEVIDSIMSCQFNISETRKRLVYSIATTRSRIREASNGLMKSPLCIDPHDAKTCTYIDENQLTEICLKDYKHSVTKVSSLRFPNNYIASLTDALKNPEVDTRILHLVRDPRPNIDSRVRAHWFPSLAEKPVSTFSKWCNNSCHHIQRNVEFFMNAPDWVKRRYKLVRYDDMMRNPGKTFEEIYQFARFEMTEKVKEWIRMSTNPTEEEIEVHKNDKPPLVQNSKGNVDKWMNRSSPLQIQIIEQNCQPLMKLLGYRNLYYDNFKRNDTLQ